MQFAMELYQLHSPFIPRYAKDTHPRNKEDAHYCSPTHVISLHMSATQWTGKGSVVMMITNQHMCQPYKNEWISDTQIFSHRTYLNRRLNILHFWSTPRFQSSAPNWQSELPTNTHSCVIPKLHYRYSTNSRRRRKRTLHHACLLAMTK